MQNNEQDQFDDFDDLTGGDAGEIMSDDDMAMVPGAGEDKARRKRQMVFYAGLFGVLCVGAVAAWLMLSGDKPSDGIPTPAPMPQASATPSPAVAPTAAPLPEGVTAGNETPAVNGLVPTDTMSAPAEPSVAAAASSAVIPAPSEQLDETAVTDNAAIPVPSAPTAESDATTAAALPAPDQQSATQEEAITDVSMTETAPAADQEAVERLSAMESQLQTLAAELTAAKQAAPTPANPDPALSGKLQELTAKLDQMTSQLDGLDQRTATLAQNSASAEMPKAPTKIEKVIATKEEEEISELSLSDEMPKPATPVKKAAAPVKKPVVKKAAAPAPVRSWELRSAQPGVAWLGRPGSGEMARYAVGENVPGLGTVRSVSQDANGNWSVNTNGGVIRQ
jgi:hypothetical protein